MNKLSLATAFAASLAIEGCSSGSNHCKMSGGDITTIDSSARALQVCEQNRRDMMKCIISNSDSSTKGVETSTVNCADPDHADQITKAFSNGYTFCNAAADANSIQVTCD